MVHMSVGDENMGHLEKVSGIEIRQISEIEENRPPFIRESNEKTWVSPWGID